MLNRLANAGIPLAAVLQDVSDETDDSDDLEAELDDMPITDSCDAVRCVSCSLSLCAFTVTVFHAEFVMSNVGPFS